MTDGDRPTRAGDCSGLALMGGDIPMAHTLGVYPRPGR